MVNNQITRTELNEERRTELKKLIKSIGEK